ncbi:MAG: DUF1178 family protein, partial [Acetobacteraceae bacterium]|nr:DUF1178 family protein [Acetobacteraceae bacterium]
MIHYQLRCDDGHGFDGWFKDSAAFEKLARRGLVECPSCGGTSVSRALMTPAIGAAARQKGRPAPLAAPLAAPLPAPPSVVPDQAALPSSTAVAGARIPAEMMAKLQRMRAEIEARCDYVGKEFAAEARRIAAGESDRTGIYGEATREEAEALRE